jgi:hypothetical protein
MVKVSRSWATPLVMGVFLLMAVTGLLLFFHVDTGLNRTAHEWLGWLLLAAAAAHALANGPGLVRHLTSSRRAQAILLASALMLGLSWLPLGGSDQAPPPALALRAVADAPIRTVAAVAGKTPEQLLQDLAAAGLDARNAEQPLREVSGDDRGRLGLAIRTALAKS